MYNKTNEKQAKKPVFNRFLFAKSKMDDSANQNTDTYQDAQELINIINNFHTDAELKSRMSKNCKNLFETKYSAEIIYQEYAIHCEKTVERAKNAKTNL